MKLMYHEHCKEREKKKITKCRVYWVFAYFAEIKNFFVESIVDKGKS